MNSPKSPVSLWQTRLFAVSVFVLAISGLGQMPLFKRYYVADIPGLAWTADFFVQHVLHYVAAGVFLALVAYWAVIHLRIHSRKYRITLWGWLRVATVAALIGTGFFRVLKNLPEWSFSPEAVMLIGWSHLAAALLFGVLALLARISGNSAYLVPRSLK
ncbi:FeS-binding protein [Desulfonatronum sp. SC1]|uniref:FeS-binding protein n=1 Tax=Desulfonatronum sp. SC1 TaxID=2109626 RepID=UPI000D2FD1CE|nr:FeS-binding protein [Desulfonatronum sp. SC1]PTN32783.1 FeS-binding protein [Desulfonatronum sp. SC1]